MVGTKLFAAVSFAAVLTGCNPAPAIDDNSASSITAGAQRLADREAIEQVLARANIGFELSDPDIRTIISDRVERSRNTDPATLSYDPASLRRYNRNSDQLIEIVDATHARHISTWLVVMKTNVDIHMSAVGRYEDELVKRDGEWLIAKRRRIE